MHTGLVNSHLDWVVWFVSRRALHTAFLINPPAGYTKTLWGAGETSSGTFVAVFTFLNANPNGNAGALAQPQNVDQYTAVKVDSALFGGADIRSACTGPDFSLVVTGMFEH